MSQYRIVKSHYQKYLFWFILLLILLFLMLTVNMSLHSPVDQTEGNQPENNFWKIKQNTISPVNICLNHRNGGSGNILLNYTAWIVELTKCANCVFQDPKKPCKCSDPGKWGFWYDFDLVMFWYVIYPTITVPCLYCEQMSTNVLSTNDVYDMLQSLLFRLRLFYNLVTCVHSVLYY